MDKQTSDKQINDLVIRLTGIRDALVVECDIISKSKERVDALYDDLDILRDDMEIFNEDVETIDDGMQDSLALIEDAIVGIDHARQAMNNI